MSDTKIHPRQTAIELIQNDILGFLKSSGLSSKYLITAFPDDPENFDLGRAQRALLVQYSSSRYAAPEGAGGGAQKRSPEFAIHMHLRSVGKPVRAPFEIDQVRLALQDQPTQGAHLYVMRDGLLGERDSVWHYVIEIACSPILAVPMPRQMARPFVTDFNQTEGS